MTYIWNQREYGFSIFAILTRATWILLWSARSTRGDVAQVTEAEPTRGVPTFYQLSTRFELVCV